MFILKDQLPDLKQKPLSEKTWAFVISIFKIMYIFLQTGSIIALKKIQYIMDSQERSTEINEKNYNNNAYINLCITILCL